MPQEFPPLPCYPCPHQSACCAFGATVTEVEAEALGARHGRELVYQARWGEWRTRVKGGRCVFLKNNVCSIHDDPHYPAVCRGFPWTDSETGGPYEYDQTICPEFVQRPELMQLGKPDRSRAT
jgi:Fe-S-cluster containining protein